MPGQQCAVCHEWIPFDPRFPQRLHICPGVALPKLQGYYCSVCGQWVRARTPHRCGGRPVVQPAPQGLSSFGEGAESQIRASLQALAQIQGRSLSPNERNRFKAAVNTLKAVVLPRDRRDYFILYKRYLHGLDLSVKTSLLGGARIELKMNPRAGGFEEGTPEYWYSYFWQELAGSATGRNMREEYFYQAYDIFGQALPLDPRDPVVAVMDQNELTTRLRAMMREGLLEYPGRFLHNTADTLLNTSAVNEMLQNPPFVAFRGEMRTPAQKLNPDNGTRAKVDIPKFVTDLRLNEAWNPFSDLQVRAKMYYRRANADNCVYTVVSVAPEFKDASKFPLIQEWFIKPCGKALVRLSNKTFREVKISLTNVYMTVVRNGAHTQKMQTAQNATEYNERGTRDIPYGDFIASWPVLRFHYNEHSGNDGHLALLPAHLNPERDPYVNSGAQIANVLGANTAGVKAAVDYFQSTAFIDCAHESVARDKRIDRVLRVDLDAANPEWVVSSQVNTLRGYRMFQSPNYSAWNDWLEHDLS